MMNNESVELANGLNLLYNEIKNGGDFSFETAGEKVLAFKSMLEQKYSRLNVEILGSLVGIISEHPDAEIEFVPLEGDMGVAIQYSYKVEKQIKLNKDGHILKNGRVLSDVSVQEK